MKINSYILFVIMLIASRVFGVNGEYVFTVINTPDGWNDVINFKAQSVATVFDCNHEPTDLYNLSIATTKAEKNGIIARFDWINDPSGYQILAYGLYKISVQYAGKSAYFYFDLRDCYYSECGISHGEFYNYPNDDHWIDVYFNYDFAADKFINNTYTLIEPYVINNGSTLGVWFMRWDVLNDLCDPGECEPCTECFNPKVYLKNQYASNTNFGRLVIDESKYINSGEFANLPINTSHTVRSEQDKYIVDNDSTQQHHWNEDETNISFKRNISINNWTMYEESNFIDLIPCILKTNSLTGGTCTIPIEFKDPWLVETGNTRPDKWHSYTTPFYPGNGYGVFLNENEDFNSEFPIYSLRVPSIKDDGDLISVFSHWSVSPSGGADLKIDSPETDVVFKTSRVVITANFYQYKRSAFQGSIPINLTLNGNINVVGDVNITGSGKVVVQPSTVIKIAQNKIIKVYGEFTANGSGIIFKPADPNYTSKSYWKGIYTYNSGKTILNNARVEGANYGLYIYYGRGYVNNCTFYNNNYGLRILYPNNSFNIDRCILTSNNTAVYSSSANVLIANSTFNNNTYGLRTYSSTGNILSNVFSNNSQGIAIYSGSLDLTTSTKNLSYINNRIQNNSNYGIYIGNSACPTLGEYYVDSKGYTHGGFNLFSRGTGAYDIYSLYASSIDARMNWWASNANRYGNFFIVPTADDGGLLKTVSQYSIDNEQDAINFQEKMSQANHLISDSLYNEAIAVYRTIISDYPHCFESTFALNGIVYSYYCLQHPEKILDELESLVLISKGKLIEIFIKDLISAEFIKNERFLEALNLLDELLIDYEKYELYEQSAYTLLNKTYLQQYLKNNLSIGKKGKTTTQFNSVECLALLYSKYPNSVAASLAKEEFGNDFIIDVPLPEQTEVLLADHRIYPNPFNPKTTISFDLPEQTVVGIIVYDLMGREVWKSAKTNYSAGTYSIIWNGVNQSGQPVGTGIYIVRLNSTKYTATQKVLLMK
ncbi:MAG: T9SS type A sorting domain-containing protein [Candidatus Marinimicrobia bacterium]|jgi:hypothetical protein|nr:T9SS type A sorting domain-containing protein [Candidatus Neomarinimicrobiota bacterium]MDD5061452.1 T9SS type A sorting domain-containing protein [Candidatus Neomarinimicrobiota bacterium]